MKMLERLKSALNSVWFFVTQHVYDILFISIAIASLFIKLDFFRNNFEYYYLAVADYTRDFSIANHIIQYGDIPLTGPRGLFGSIYVSPLYYYLLAALLMIKNGSDVINLGFANIFFQMVALCVVYLLAAGLFDKRTAFIASLFFSFAYVIVLQSAYPWQPYFMQPFAYASYFLLFLSYRRGSYPILLIASFVFIFAAVLHYSVFALTPLFLFLAFLIIRNQRGGVFHYAGALVTLAGSLFIFYLPVLIYTMNLGQVVSRPFLSELMSLLKIPSAAVLGNFFSSGALFLQYFFDGAKDSSEAVLLISLIILVVTAFYFSHSPQDRLRKLYVGFLLASVLLSISAVAFLKNPPAPSELWRYFIPVFGLFAIFIAEIINSTVSQLVPLKKSIPPVTVLISILLLFVVISPNLFAQFKGVVGGLRGPTVEHASVVVDNVALPVESFSANPGFIANALRFFTFQRTPHPALEPMIKEILAIREEERRADFYFFQIQEYNEGGQRWIFANSPAEPIWGQLEERVDTQLLRADDASYLDGGPIGTASYIFLKCPYVEELNGSTTCTSSFLRDYPAYSVMRKVFDGPPFAVYLAGIGRR